MRVEHQLGGISPQETATRDFSAIKDPNLREFIEEFASNPPIPLDSPVKVWDAVRVCFDRIKVSPTVRDEVKDLPGNQFHTVAKQLSIFVQRQNILRFEPRKENTGYGQFKAVKDESLLALAALAYIDVETEFLKESNLGGSYPELNKVQFLAKKEELRESGVFEGILRPSDEAASVWEKDFKKRMEELEDQLVDARLSREMNGQKTVGRKPKEFLDGEESEFEKDVMLDDDIVFTHQGFNEGIIIDRIEKGIEEGKYKEWTTERLLNLAFADYDDPVHAVAPMTEDVYFMVKTIMVAVSKRAGDAYKYGRMQNEITYREYREILTGISIVMDNTERDLVFQRMMPKEDRGTLLLSDVFKHVWGQHHKSKLDFPGSSS